MMTKCLIVIFRMKPLDGAGVRLCCGIAGGGGLPERSDPGHEVLPHHQRRQDRRRTGMQCQLR